MATKSRVRKKNGKPVKYKAKPKGISKTQMKKILKMIEDQQKLAQDGSSEIPETREDGGELLISPEFIKKINVAASEDIKEGPILSGENKSDELVEENGGSEEKQEYDQEQGPFSSEI